MEFYTIHLGQKRSQVILRSKVEYDMYNIYPELNFIKENNMFKIDEGNKFFDFIGDQGPLEFMSEKLKNLIEENEITGLSFFPIIIDDQKVKYFGFVRDQIVNSIFENDSDGDFIHGTLRVDVNSWKGTDIFKLKNCGGMVCTPRAKEIIEKAKITNIEFDDLSNY